jgi:hypothetical protein
VYILHQTVIVVVAHALKPSHLYAPVEGILLVLVTVATCFLGYEAIRRVRLLQAVFGLARDSDGARGKRARTANRGAPETPRLGREFSVPQDTN